MLIYLHGLNSSGRSHKAGVLRQKLAPTPVLAPTYPAHRPDEAVGQLSAFFDGTTRKSPRVTPVVVGSSMGGFYGQFLARRFAVAHLFLINPALTPWTLLADYLGQAMTTADGEAYRITPEMLHRTRSYAIDDPCDGTPTTLFLDEGDEVIDYRIAQALYRQCARLEVFEGGDHSFAHMDDAVSLIRVSLQGLV